MKKDIPLYNITLDKDSLGIYTISLVDEPAVESNLFMFSRQDDKKLYCLSNEKEHCILACVVRTDFPIYRKDEDGYEYFIEFSKEVSKEIAQRFFKNGFQCNVNIMHSDMYVNDSVELREMFIKDTDKGISPKGFEDIAEGSLFAVYQIKDNTLWAEIEKGTFRGLSLEGFFKPVKNTTLNTLSELFDYIK